LLYYRLRAGRGAELAGRLTVDPATEVVVIGDAARAGKAREAITSAFEVALQPRAVPAARS
jgi:dimethylglycine catabolism A